MMVMTAKVDKKKILIGAAAVLVLIIMLFTLLGGNGDDTTPTAATVSNNDARVEFLKSFGWDVAATSQPKLFKNSTRASLFDTVAAVGVVSSPFPPKSVNSMMISTSTAAAPISIFFLSTFAVITIINDPS